MMSSSESPSAEEQAPGDPPWVVVLRALGLVLLLQAPFLLTNLHGAGPLAPGKAPRARPDGLSFALPYLYEGALPLLALGALATGFRAGLRGSRAALRCLLRGGGSRMQRRLGAEALGDAARAVVLGGLAMAFVSAFSIGVELRVAGDGARPAMLAGSLSRTLSLSFYVPMLSLWILAPAANRGGVAAGAAPVMSGAWPLAQFIVLVPVLLASLVLLSTLPLRP